MKAKVLAIFVTILVAMTVVQTAVADGGIDLKIPCALPGNLKFGLPWTNVIANELFHTGSDYTCNQGTPIEAPVKGKIILIQENWQGYKGWEVFLNIGLDSNNQPINIFYAHLLDANGLAVGQIVEVGTVIGHTNGCNFDMTNCHLHVGYANIDPSEFYRFDLYQSDGEKGWADPAHVPAVAKTVDGIAIKVGDQLRTSSNGIQVNTMGPDGKWSQGQAPQIGFQVSWNIIIPVGALGFLVLFTYKRPEVVFGVTGELMFRVRDRLFMPRVKRDVEDEHGWLWAISEGIRMGMRWWLVSVVFVFLAAPYALLVVRMLFNKTLTSSIQIPTGFVLLLIPAYFVNLTIIRLLNRGDRLAEKRQYRPVSRLGWIVTVVAFMFVISLGNQLINAKIAQAVAAAGGNPSKASSFLTGLPDLVGDLGSSLGLNKTLTKQVATAAVDKYTLITDGWAKIKAICGDIGCKDPALLYSIWVSESGKVDCTASKADPLSTGPGTCRSTQGALGACQFIPGTWAIYGNGNLDDIWELGTCIPAMNKMVGALNLYDQPDRISFANRFSAQDGGSCWNCGKDGYDQALRVWDLWQTMKGM